MIQLCRYYEGNVTETIESTKISKERQSYLKMSKSLPT